MATVSVHVLSSGIFTMPEDMLVSTAKPGDYRTVPTLSFLIQHGSTRFVYDLGLRRNLDEYSQELCERLKGRKPIETVPCVIDSLGFGNLKANDIDYIVLSHIHFDHVGTPWHFPTSTFLVGPQTLGLMDGSIKLEGAHHNFEQAGLPVERTVELPLLPSVDSSPQEAATKPADTSKLAPNITLNPWRPLGPFPHVLDLFQDGSLYIVSGPGHVPGHLIMIARVSTEPLRWILLAGDAVHDQGLLDGLKEFGIWTDPVLGCMACLHYDQPTAKDTIAKIRDVRDHGLLGGDVEVVFAHDVAWTEDAKRRNRFWPGHL